MKYEDINENNTILIRCPFCGDTYLARKLTDSEYCSEAITQENVLINLMAKQKCYRCKNEYSPICTRIFHVWDYVIKLAKTVGKP
jgi:hypothetical protein